jgi:hypothetical protein
MSAALVPAFGQVFTPGNLVVSRSVYQGTASTVTVGQALPPSCPGGNTKCTTAVADGTYPGVWQNDKGVAGPPAVKGDGSFGVTSPILLDHTTTGGVVLNTVAIDPTQMVTSFPSKSELALNLSTDGTVLTFMGYSLGTSNTTSLVNTLDASNSNTPGIFDSTNPVGTSFYRAVGVINANGNLTVNVTNAYNGNNGRAAIYANRQADPGLFYTVGNSNNGSGTTTPIVTSTGLEVVTPGATASSGPNCTVATTVGPCTTMVAPNLVIVAGDKAGKDSNFRGLTISPGANGMVYITKGSGSNGIDTVYVVTPPSGSLPTAANAATTTIAVAPGFPTAVASTAGANNVYPFGLWFANATTLYVADEGDGAYPFDQQNSPYPGLQKWTFNGTQWNLQYALQNGLNLGQPYSVPGYPSNLNPATGGLRNITGRVNADGTATIWAITSTISSNFDTGADPNQLVMISDVLDAQGPTAPAGETFSVLRTAGFGEVLRGVSFAPSTQALTAPALDVTSSALLYNRRTARYTGTISILNNSTSAVTGPYSVELTNLAAGVTLANGTTINSFPAINVVPNGTTLQPGQSMSASVSFSDATNVAIIYTPVVVAQ